MQRKRKSISFRLRLVYRQHLPEDMQFSAASASLSVSLSVPLESLVCLDMLVFKAYAPFVSIVSILVLQCLDASQYFNVAIWHLCGYKVC